MSLDTTHDQLKAAWKLLSQRWEGTSALWRDAVRDRFEKEYWKPLETQVPATCKGMSRLAQVIAQSRRSIT